MSIYSTKNAFPVKLLSRIDGLTAMCWVRKCTGNILICCFRLCTEQVPRNTRSQHLERERAHWITSVLYIFCRSLVFYSRVDKAKVKIRCQAAGTHRNSTLKKPDCHWWLIERHYWASSWHLWHQLCTNADFIDLHSCPWYHIKTQT